jgi:hypothetical protein
LTVLLDEADARYGGHISTHYEGCYLDHVGCFAVAVRDVFEQAHAKELDTSTEPAKNGGDSLHVDQAHTPTEAVSDDEREALEALDILHRYAFGSNEIGREQVSNMVEIISDRLRRTAVQEPGEREAKIHGELVTMRVKEWRRITGELARLRTMEGQLEEPEPGKRLDPDFRSDLVDAASHRITDAWADVPEGVDAETLAQNVVAAQEFLWIARGFPVAVQEPQSEPTDAQAWAAARAVADLRKRETGAPAWFNVDHARAALRAAFQEGENR